MIRYPDWERRLAEYLEPLRDRPFAWGSHDCCTFAAGAVEVMTGVDAMAEFRGHYTNEAESGEVLNTVGKGNLAATLDDKFEPIRTNVVHRGDLVLTDSGLGIAFGLVSFHVGAAGEREGLVTRPRTVWRKAWRVPMPGAERG